MPKSKKRKPSAKRAPNSAPQSKAQAVQADVQENPSADGAATKKKSVGAFEFLQQVRNEGAKVSWTSRNETFISTIMVLIMVAIASVFFFLVDQVWYWLVPLIISLG